MSGGDGHGSNPATGPRLIHLVDPPVTTVRVLLIEKDPELTGFIRTALDESGAGFELETASRLSSGLAVLSREGADLVLVDLDLPDIRGSAAIRFLRRAAPTTPLIALSGTDDLDVALGAVRAGAEECISRSMFSAQSLVWLVVLVLERHRRLETDPGDGPTDSLTGLPSFSALEVFGRYLLRLSNRTGMDLGLLYVRLEPAGDGRWSDWEALVVEVFRTLDQTLRRCDLLSRVGPLELAVVLLSDGGNLAGVLPRVRNALAASAASHVHIGLAVHRPGEAQTLDRLLELARGEAAPIPV